MKLIGMLPESQQEALMEVGMRAMQDPHVQSLAMLPASLALAYTPHFVKGGLILAHGKTYNLDEPRQMDRDTRTLAANSAYGALLRRCQACHQNALEGFPAFAVAVLAAKVFIESRSGAKAAAAIARRYVFVRILYTIAYIGGVHRGVAVARALLWSDGLRCIYNLFGQALRG